MAENSDDSLVKIKLFMEETLDKHGHIPLGVGWRSRENQYLRFDQFRYMFKEVEAPFTLNDLGCGLGDLYEWTKDRSLPIAKYVGYDISSRMVEDARSKHNEENVLFFESSTLLKKADFSIACGIFSTRLDESENAWEDYMKTVVLNLAQNSEVAFAFNSLTSYVDWREPHLFYANPNEWFDWCKRNISPRIALLHDSKLYEWTMVVRL